MRTATNAPGTRPPDPFEPIDLGILATLTENAVDAAATDPAGALRCLLDAERHGGGFVVAWSLATMALRSGEAEAGIDKSDGPLPDALAGLALASELLEAVDARAVFRAAGSYLSAPASVRSTTLVALCAVVGHLQARAAAGGYAGGGA